MRRKAGAGAAACPQAVPGQTHKAEQTDGGAAGSSLGRALSARPGPARPGPGALLPRAPWEARAPRSDPRSGAGTVSTGARALTAPRGCAGSGRELIPGTGWTDSAGSGAAARPGCRGARPGGAEGQRRFPRVPQRSAQHYKPGNSGPSSGFPQNRCEEVLFVAIGFGHSPVWFPRVLVVRQIGVT